MLIGLFRRLIRTQVLAVLLAAVIGGGAMDWAHAGWDDPGCDPLPVQHDHSAHRFTTGAHTPAAPSDHCALCHLLRLFHSALSAQSPAPYVLVSAEARRPFDGAKIIQLFSARVPSRAPPALTL
jgi:hypothetical protein